MTGIHSLAPSEENSYAQTDDNVPNRNPEWASYDRETVHSILDEAYVCHLGFVRQGTPTVLPTVYARVGEHLYMHGSVDSRLAKISEPPGGQPVCVTVTHIDGIILGRSAFRHGINYRSVVIHGTAQQVTDPPEIQRALIALVEQVIPGRSHDTRPPNASELAAVAVIRVGLSDVCAKIRVGGPNEVPGDEGLKHWSGQIPLEIRYGTPVPADDITPDVPLPDYLRAFRT